MSKPTPYVKPAQGDAPEKKPAQMTLDEFRQEVFPTLRLRGQTPVWVAGWDSGALKLLWINPKATITCGGCFFVWKTRDYFPVSYRNEDVGVAARCPDCRKINYAPVVFDSLVKP